MAVVDVNMAEVLYTFFVKDDVYKVEMCRHHRIERDCDFTMVNVWKNKLTVLSAHFTDSAFSIEAAAAYVTAAIELQRTGEYQRMLEKEGNDGDE